MQILIINTCKDRARMICHSVSCLACIYGLCHLETSNCTQRNTCAMMSHVPIGLVTICTIFKGQQISACVGRSICDMHSMTFRNVHSWQKVTFVVGSKRPLVRRLCDATLWHSHWRSKWISRLHEWSLGVIWSLLYAVHWVSCRPPVSTLIIIFLVHVRLFLMALIRAWFM